MSTTPNATWTKSGRNPIGCARQLGQKSIGTTPAATWAKLGGGAIAPAGFADHAIAAIAATEFSSQFNRNTTHVSARLVVRRPLIGVPGTNIGTAVSTSDANAMTARMTEAFKRNSRPPITYLRDVMVEVRRPSIV